MRNVRGEDRFGCQSSLCRTKLRSVPGPAVAPSVLSSLVELSSCYDTEMVFIRQYPLWVKLGKFPKSGLHSRGSSGFGFPEFLATVTSAFRTTSPAHAVKPMFGCVWSARPAMSSGAVLPVAA